MSEAVLSVAIYDGADNRVVKLKVASWPAGLKGGISHRFISEEMTVGGWGNIWALHSSGHQVDSSSQNISSAL